MAEYQRLISYIYSYTKAGRDANAGFARMELRNRQWKITINIRLHNEEELTAYLFQRIEGKMYAVPIGKLQIKGGNGVLRIQTDEQDVCGTSLPMKQLQGIVIVGNSSIFYGTSWDEEGIARERLVFMSREEFQKNVQEKLRHRAEIVSREEEKMEERREIRRKNPEEEEKKRQETERKIEEESIVQEPDIEEKTAEEGKTGRQEMEEKIGNKESAEARERTEEKEAGKEEIAEKETAAAGEADAMQEYRPAMAEYIPEAVSASDLESQSVAEIQRDVEESEEVQALEKVMRDFPKMYPFEDDEILDCVRLELQDLSSLPMENWVLANNSFLLHGFYCYRHLILAKKKDSHGKDVYQMGIPGIHHIREEHVAHMFGFDDFKSIRNTKEKTGEFGYWWIPIKSRENFR